MTHASAHRKITPPHSCSHDAPGAVDTRETSDAVGPIALTRREMLSVGLGAIAGMRLWPGTLVGPDVVSQGTGNGLDRMSGAARPELDVALRAARWVRSTRVETRHGVTWPADPGNPESVETNLYNGMPGVVLFHLELYHATGDRTWLSDARAGANELIARLPAILESQDWGLYTGIAGAAFVLEETHRATGEGRYRDGAKAAVKMIHDGARKPGLPATGVAWSGESATSDIISGSSGIGLFLLWIDRHMRDSASRELAIDAGRRLLEVGEPALGGIKWAVAPNVPTLYPNFSHGTAGVSYFLARLYQASNERAFLDAALAGARYLNAVANTERDGFEVFHHEPGGEDLYYLSWCHGPAGVSRLFYQLAMVTHDEQWLEMMRRAARATMNSGLPEQRSPGFWNNISQCCGNSGVGEYFISLQRIMPDPQYLQMTRRVAADTLRRSTVAGDGLKWIQAENRVQPENVVAQTGFMQGASGVGTFFLHLDALAQEKRAPAIDWPDTPFV